ncbi:hypothetical protein J7T55_008382 [Diaporthe amygdali]|uniref:uncharacterized protein n=1 Tax=Phomopsis amygdali TaxID=1214568 RepID=UPI0022FEE9A7|nr:uncharacterized protein J7T55_008382 [Diaporthe amygdali]KAJ0121219.1 hypothetical protein J7T55_008382 [Diaporthe amygdali]
MALLTSLSKLRTSLCNDLAMSVSSENEPVNLLALDGGGIRGVSELVILDEVMKTVQQKGNLASLPKPCDYFHLFGGTSTGGLVAIMLGRLEMGTQEALEAYDNFASAIFSKRRLSITEKYKAKALEKTVKKLVREQGKGSVMRNRRPTQEKGHAFVCTMPAQRHKETVCLRTYDVAGDKYPNCLIYEAARATTAATTYFKPMAIKDEEGKEEKFVDAALGTNNPISILWDEAVSLFGKKRRLGCVVSLGTGSRKVEMAPGGEKLIEKAKFLISAIKVMKEIGTDSEKDHERWQTKFEEFDNTYFRLNVDGGAQGIELSDWEKIGELKARTREYLQNSKVKKSIDDLAEVLLGNKNSGLNLAHGASLSKETTIPAEPRAIRRGKSSNIFTGRETILKRLDKHFGPREPGNTSRREFHLRGMGGVEERKDPVQDVLTWLQKSDEEWLLVFDNAPATSLANYLPDGNHGNVLYTSRQHNLEPRLRPECVASIETMDTPEAILLLLRSAQKPVEDSDNHELARPIVNALGLLPLAIDQAGAYIHMAPCPLEEYLEVFNEQKEVLLRSPRFKGSDEKRHVAVYATFNISYRAIKAFADKKEDLARAKDAQTALKLLNLICFYHNEGFIGIIFERAATNRYRMGRVEHFPWKACEVELEDLIETFETDITPEHPDGRDWLCADVVHGLGFLNEFSLLKFDISVDYVNMHILVHDWARDRMDSKEKSDWGVAAKSLIMDSITIKGDVRSLQYRRDIVPHMEACLKRVNAEHDDLALESEYLITAAKVFQQVFNLDAAEAMLEKAIEYRKIYFGLLHPSPFKAMSALARLYADRTNYPKAVELYLEVIDRRTLYLKELKWQAFQEAHATTADEEAHHKAVFDAYDPLDDQQLRSLKSALASVLVTVDNMSAAADLFVELMRWNEAKHGSGSEQARKFRNFAERARVAQDPRNGGDSKDMTIQGAQENLENTKTELGEFHPSTMRAKKHLARALIRAGALTEAQKLLWNVCQWSEDLYGKDSSQHADAVLEMAHLLWLQNRLYDAGDMYTLAMYNYGIKLGKHHPKTLGSMQHLAVCFAGRAEFTRAAEIIEDCLGGCKVVLGADHSLTLFCAHASNQFRYYEKTVPEYVRADVYNSAVEANRDAWGDLAPQWMQEWKPVSTETMMRECLERGETLQKYKLEEVDVEGYPFFQLTPVEEHVGLQAMEITLQ